MIVVPTPNGATDAASDSTAPSSANFEEAYASLNGAPTTPLALVVTNSRPRLARRCGSAALMTARLPKKLRSITYRYPSIVICSAVPRA